MGILNSMGRKMQDEEGEIRLLHRQHPVLTPWHNGYYNSSSSSTTQKLLRILLYFPKLLYNASKMLFQKVGIIFHLLPDQDDDPILPVTNPQPAPPKRPIIRSSSSIYDPLLAQTRLNSVAVLPSQQRASSSSKQSYLDKLKQINNDVKVFIPSDFTRSCIAHARPIPHEDIIKLSTVKFTTVLPPQNVPNRPSSTVVSGQIKEKVGTSTVKSSSVSSTAVVAVDEGIRIRWIKHYSSRHRILIVGDGDFSFSACLAVAFGSSASNIIATSLDFEDFLKNNYRRFMTNMKELKSRGCKVMHEIDATKIASHAILGKVTFDRIIYNFPYAGLDKKLSRETQLRRHRKLVSSFLKNAREMISDNGEIHITHKTNGFHREWKLLDIASSQGLRCIETVDFDNRDYPGYSPKFGFGGDGNFDYNPSKTYKFGLKMSGVKV